METNCLFCGDAITIEQPGDFAPLRAASLCSCLLERYRSVLTGVGLDGEG